MADTSRPEVRSFPWARGYQAHFRMPGGRWQFVRVEGGKEAAIYPTSEAAKDAATALIFRFMCPPIVAQRADEPDPVAAKITADIVEFQDRKARQIVEDRKILRGLGKGFVAVETKRRRGA